VQFKLPGRGMIVNETTTSFSVYETLKKKGRDTGSVLREKNNHSGQAFAREKRRECSNLCATLMKQFKGGMVNHQFSVFLFYE
jgi:hypothetical protein